VLTLLLDENIDGYAPYLSRLLFSPAWSDISSALDVRLVKFSTVGIARGTTDEQLWEVCQRQQYYLVTDNRNRDGPDSLEEMIRDRTLPGSLPVFTISDIPRFRSERSYAEAVVGKLLEYLMDAPNLAGSGRLYLP
jgi:hypothetical protein